jgi:hypothetical protein
MREPLTVTTQIDPQTGAEMATVSSWPRELGIDVSCLGMLAGRYVQIEDPTITFTFANGTATYRLALSEAQSSELTAYLISSRLQL